MSKVSVKRDVVWTALDTIVSQGLAFLFRLSLAKFLAPELFGVIAMTLTTVAILQVINEFGLTAALIQRDEENFNDDVVNSVFGISVIVSTVLFLSNLLIVAPLSARYFNVPGVAPLTAVVGLSLLFTPFSSVCRALLYRTYAFKTVTIVRFFSSFVSIVTGFVMLVLWPSVWAFAAQVIIGQILLSAGLLAYTPWKPRLKIDRAAFRNIFSYSGLVFLNDLAVTLARNLDVIIIGRLLTASDVGLYAFAFFLTDTVRQNLMSVLNRVMFVHYSKAQNDSEALRSNYLRTVQWNCKSLFPVMVCMILFGPGIAEHVMGKAWSGMGTVLQLLSVSVMIHAAGGTSSTLYKAIGRPGLDLALFLSTTILFVVPALLIGGIYWGMVGVALGVAVAKLFSTVVRQLLLDRLVGSTLLSVLKLLALNMLGQLPIVAVWGLGLILWPTGSWLRDAILAVFCLVAYGCYIATTSLPIAQRLGLKRNVRTMQSAE